LNCKCCRGNSINLDGDVFHFCKKKQGVIPRLLDALIDRRDRIRNIMERTQKGTNSYIELSARRQIIKILANSFYGYLGFSSGRWYSVECARSVTGFSREYIKKVIDKAQSLNYKVIYGDTDSVFLDIGNLGKGSINKFKDDINKELPHPIELEFGGLYPAGIFFSKRGETRGAKKRYALLRKDDSLVLKGVEAIRENWSAIAKKAQVSVLRILLKGGSLDEASRYLNDLLNDVRARRVNIDDLAINITLTRHPYQYKVRVPHVAAADIAQKRGYKVGPGFTVSYIVGLGFGKISDRVILTEDARLDDYDIDYYIDHQIMRATYQLFEVFDNDEDAQATLRKSY